MEYIEFGKSEGVIVEIGGVCYGDKGYFIQFIIFINVSFKMKIMQEEIFGFVCVIVKFDIEEEVFQMVYDIIYGFVFVVYIKDFNIVIWVVNFFCVGIVWVNCYNLFLYQLLFGGYVQSGIGCELGEEVLVNYM